MDWSKYYSRNNKYLVIHESSASKLSMVIQSIFVSLIDVDVMDNVDDIREVCNTIGYQLEQVGTVQTTGDQTHDYRKPSQKM